MAQSRSSEPRSGRVAALPGTGWAAQRRSSEEAERVFPGRGMGQGKDAPGSSLSVCSCRNRAGLSSLNLLIWSTQLAAVLTSPGGEPCSVGSRVQPVWPGRLHAPQLQAASEIPAQLLPPGSPGPEHSSPTAWSLPCAWAGGPRAEGVLTEDSQSRRKSTLRYALMPSMAPGRVTPRRSRANRTTYGMVAVTHTTWESTAPSSGLGVTPVGGLVLGSPSPRTPAGAGSARAHCTGRGRSPSRNFPGD